MGSVRRLQEFYRKRAGKGLEKSIVECRGRMKAVHVRRSTGREAEMESPMSDCPQKHAYYVKAARRPSHSKLCGFRLRRVEMIPLINCAGPI